MLDKHWLTRSILTRFTKGKSTALTTLTTPNLSYFVSIYRLSLSALILSAPGTCLGFNIVLNYVNPPTASQAAAFSAAESTWESLITGYQESDIQNTNLNIDVNLAPIDGPGMTLGSAGPTGVKLNGAGNAIAPNFLYAQSGAMTFDTADTDALEMAGTFGEVILHEMGHVLGIGTLWNSDEIATANANPALGGRQAVYNTGSGQYTGANGLAAYNAEFNQAGAFVPVELGGGPGTADGHWNEIDNGAGLTGIVSNETGQDLAFELMTGWLNPGSFISSLTLGSLEDIGFVVVPEPSTVLLGVIGLGFLARRRR